MYTEKVIEHFRNPRNMGKLEGYSAVGKVGNIVCGDVMWLYIKVEEDAEGREVISDISWETFGCTAAIATSSMVSELAKGKTLPEAIAITNQDVASELGGLPPVKMHCSALAADALNEAIYEYLKGHGREIPPVLKRRHERLEAEMKKLEERYRAFLEEAGS
ncbi:iron-sulfur cluster assembly scaffold protein [Candidatus Acetothermia bacterium]|nr:MAG: iron-sulfur cluster assembly scaffold protein [Candidatus Acetothermia bacterium]HHK67405.1 iron-sulfur cluster assembly scaffold protein [Candidatus Acetothermia bacterium]